MKNISITIGIIAVFLGGLVWISGGAGSGGNADPAFGGLSALSAEERQFDFGRISMSAGNVSHAFRVKNQGPSDLTISRLYTSCMCTTASLETADGRSRAMGMPGHGPIPELNKTIAPGEEATVEVVFDPAAHGPAGVGPVTRVVYLESGGERFELRFSANVTP